MELYMILVNVAAAAGIGLSLVFHLKTTEKNKSGIIIIAISDVCANLFMLCRLYFESFKGYLLFAILTAVLLCMVYWLFNVLPKKKKRRGREDTGTGFSWTIPQRNRGDMRRLQPDTEIDKRDIRTTISPIPEKNRKVSSAKTVRKKAKRPDTPITKIPEKEASVFELLPKNLEADVQEAGFDEIRQGELGPGITQGDLSEGAFQSNSASVFTGTDVCPGENPPPEEDSLIREGIVKVGAATKADGGLKDQDGLLEITETEEENPGESDEQIRQREIFEKAALLKSQGKYLIASQLYEVCTRQTGKPGVARAAEFERLECLISAGQYQDASSQLFGILNKHFELQPEEKAKIKQYMNVLEAATGRAAYDEF